MPEPITPAGPLSTSAASLRRMLADCPTWQRELQVSSWEEALEPILLRNAGHDQRRPYAIISPGDMHEGTLIGGGDQNWIRDSGSLFLYITRDSEAPFEDDMVAAEFAAMNFFGQVLREIADRSARDYGDARETFLPIVRFSKIRHDETPEEHWQSLGRFWWAVYSIEWGDG